MHRHIGDFTLFWTGVYPEVLKKTRTPLCKDHFIDYCEQGKRSYYIASTFADAPFQEEATVLGVPCLTMRECTERPATVTDGTNRVVGTSAARIVEEAWRVLDEPLHLGKRPALWDGRASERIISILRH